MFSSQVPIPTINITSGTVIVGSDVTLTCTVDLDPAVNVPVTVNTVWTGPNGVTLSPSDPVMVNLTRYTSTAMVSSFRAGNYTCTATVSSSTSFIISSIGSKSTTVTVGKAVIITEH